MSSIEELQQRVVQAEERFGLINAERAKYSERLMGLIDAIETRLNDQQDQIGRQASEAASHLEELETLRHDSAENKLLRGMLQSLLNAIELGNSDALSQTMQVMDDKISALLADSGAAEAVPEAAEAGLDDAAAPEAEALEMEAAESEMPEAEPVETEAPDEEVSDTAPLEAEAAEVGAAETADLDEGGLDGLAEESAAPVSEGAEVAEPEVEVAEATVAEPEPVAEPVADAPDPGIEAAAVATSEEIEVTAEAEEPNVAEAPEDIQTALEPDAADDIQAPPESATEIQAEPEPEAGTEAPEIMDIPASDADITMIDEEMVIGAASDEAPQTAEPPAAEAATENPEAEAPMENLVDEDDADLSIPAVAEAEEQKPEASSLEDIMRRVSKLVEEEGALGPLAAGGVQVGADAQSPEAPSSEPAATQKSASGV